MGFRYMIEEINLAEQTSGSLRIAFSHLESAEQSIAKTGDRLGVDINADDPESNRLSQSFSNIRKIRREIAAELT